MKTTAKNSTPDIILDNAQALMIREGFHGVSVDRIIELSGVSKGTFFYHFKSKELLAEKMLKRFFARQSETIKNFVEEAKSKHEEPFEQLLYFLEGYPERFRENTRNGCLIAAFSYQLIDELPQLRDLCKQAVQGWDVFFTPFIEAAVGTIPKETNAKALSQMLFSLMEGAFILERIEESSHLDRQFQLFSQFLRSLKINS